MYQKSREPELLFFKCTYECICVRLCVRMYMCWGHVYTCGRAQIYICIWRPEDSLGCHPQECFLPPLAQGLMLACSSSIKPGLLASNPPEILLSVYPSLGITGVSPNAQIFKWEVEIEFGSSCLCHKHFLNWAIFPAWTWFGWEFPAWSGMGLQTQCVGLF